MGRARRRSRTCACCAVFPRTGVGRVERLGVHGRVLAVYRPEFRTVQGQTSARAQRALRARRPPIPASTEDIIIRAHGVRRSRSSADRIGERAHERTPPHQPRVADALDPTGVDGSGIPTVAATMCSGSRESSQAGLVEPLGERDAGALVVCPILASGDSDPNDRPAVTCASSPRGLNVPTSATCRPSTIRTSRSRDRLRLPRTPRRRNGWHPWSRICPSRRQSAPGRPVP